MTHLRLGQFDRDYATQKTQWVPRGFSKQSDRYVYPNTGWSWTDWGGEVKDTYDTLEQAKSAITSGYLKDMIKAQDIVDIVFLEVKVDRQIVEKKSVKAYTGAGKLKALTEPVFHVGPGKTALTMGDYVFLNLNGRSEPDIFGRVMAIHKDIATVWILNGAWTLLMRLDGLDLFIAADDRSGMGGKPIHLHYVGPLPDPTIAPRDYEGQLEALRGMQSNGCHYNKA
ncbi:hypothetical protein D869_gp033 [Caulobacter phage CcrRogue]|uniref:Uncharacterized protein n=1 Tax=Caulobacter phage CcrRogue TaxID=2927986 RepID=K4JQG9_9CAUD|nr:hypothetical protein D869_gp033 [Caulobacter phage CcrRogue]AFU86515.1 hypothetical protein CcrRogue_gp033 [Caulobacter phage CcrRogue]